jgi:hypothetical protein
VANYLVKKGAEYLADKAGVKIPEPVKWALDPVGSVVGALAPKVNEALGVAPGSAEAALDPKGFAKNLAKEVGKDYLKDKEEIPEEDRSFASTGGNKLQELDAMEYEGDYKRGGKVKATTASRRGDGIAQRGKTRGRYL